jgi:hypothetical protein
MMKTALLFCAEIHPRAQLRKRGATHHFGGVLAGKAIELDGFNA